MITLSLKLQSTRFIFLVSFLLGQTCSKSYESIPIPKRRTGIDLKDSFWHSDFGINKSLKHLKYVWLLIVFKLIWKTRCPVFISTAPAVHIVNAYLRSHCRTTERWRESYQPPDRSGWGSITRSPRVKALPASLCEVHGSNHHHTFQARLRGHV